MDKEAREKLARLIWLGNYADSDVAWNIAEQETKDYWLGIANKYLSLIESLGYRKLPKDKPPLLSDEELFEHLSGFNHISTTRDEQTEMLRNLAQAEQGLCVEHYEGK